MIDHILEALSDGQQHTIDDLMTKLPTLIYRKSVLICLKFLENYGFVIIQYIVQPNKDLMPEKVIISSEVRMFLERIKREEAQH